MHISLFFPSSKKKERLNLSNNKLQDAKVIKLGVNVSKLGIELEASLLGQLGEHGRVSSLSSSAHEADVQADVHGDSLRAEHLLDDKDASVRSDSRLADVLPGADDILIGEIVEHAAVLVDQSALGLLGERLEHAAADLLHALEVLVAFFGEVALRVLNHLREIEEDAVLSGDVVVVLDGVADSETVAATDVNKSWAALVGGKTLAHPAKVVHTLEGVHGAQLAKSLVEALVELLVGDDELVSRLVIVAVGETEGSEADVLGRSETVLHEVVGHLGEGAENVVVHVDDEPAEGLVRLVDAGLFSVGNAAFDLGGEDLARDEERGEAVDELKGAAHLLGQLGDGNVALIRDDVPGLVVAEDLDDGELDSRERVVAQLLVSRLEALERSLGLGCGGGHC